MEALNPMTPIQLFLTITLLTLLIIWMVTCLVLAVRPEKAKRPRISIQEAQNEQVSYTSMQATGSHVTTTHNPTSPVPAMQQQMVTVPPTHARS